MILKDEPFESTCLFQTKMYLFVITFRAKQAMIEYYRFIMKLRKCKSKIKIVLKLSIANSSFLRLPKFSESKSLVPRYLRRSQLRNNEECILRSISTARPPKDASEFGNPKTNEWRIRRKKQLQAKMETLWLFARSFSWPPTDLQRWLIPVVYKIKLNYTSFCCPFYSSTLKIQLQMKRLLSFFLDSYDSVP